MVYIESLFNIWLIISYYGSASISFKRYPGFRVRSLANYTKKGEKSISNVARDLECMLLCREEDCTEIMHYNSDRRCELFLFGRLTLESEPGSAAWLKSI